MTDRELLEMAARAVGLDYECTAHTGYPDDDQHQVRDRSGALVNWNPLADDGDAFRLACQLNMAVLTRDESTYVDVNLGKPFFIPVGTNGTKNKHESARRCIVLAAAEIGKDMK